MIKVRVESVPEISVDPNIEAIREVSVATEETAVPEVCVELQSEENHEVEVDVTKEPSEEVMVDVLAEFVPTGNAGSCLPTVTTADNGKFLRASGGRWLAQDDDCEPMSLAEIEKLLNNLT